MKEVNAEIKEKTEIRDGKLAERADLEQFKALLLNRLEELRIKKGIREEQWAHQREEHDKATAVMQNAKAILDNVFSNFLQKTPRHEIFAQVAQHFNNGKKEHFSNKSWNNLFSAMA